MRARAKTGPEVLLPPVIMGACEAVYRVKGAAARQASLPRLRVAVAASRGAAARQECLPRLRVAVAALALGERCGVRRLASVLCV